MYTSGWRAVAYDWGRGVCGILRWDPGVVAHEFLDGEMGVFGLQVEVEREDLIDGTHFPSFHS